MSGAIGIDFGSSSTIVFDKKKGIVLREPTVLAVNQESDKIIAFGAQAEQMLGRAPGIINAVCPIKHGVIYDYEMCEAFLISVLKKVCSRRFTKPDIIFSVPSCITQLEERALIDAGNAAGARRVFLSENCLASAIGAGIDFSHPEGYIIIDIGAGTCDIGVLSLGSIVESLTLPIGGNDFNEELIRSIKKNHGVLIGQQIAEEIKIQIGCAIPRCDIRKISIQGRDLKGNFIGNCELNSTEICKAFESLSFRIVEGIHSVLEKTPPDLVRDIGRTGLTLSGGGSLLWGLDEFIHKHTGICVHIADDCTNCTAFGLGRLAENLHCMNAGAIHLERKNRKEIY